jgi:hypothetical protein
MKSIMKTSLLCTVLAIFAGATPTPAREVAGLIRDKSSGAPLAAATVWIVESGSMTITDSQGHYYFPNVPEGSYTVLIGKASYVPSAMGAVSIRATCCQGTVGDANGQGGNEPTIGDVSTLIDAKFITSTCTGIIVCLTEADMNQSGGTHPTCDDITIGDISMLIDYLFITGPSAGLKPCL